MTFLSTLSNISPPTNVSAKLGETGVVISWSKPASSILGYNIYQNGVKVAFVPQISPLFEFPFLNDSLEKPQILCSEIRDLVFLIDIEPFTRTRIDISSVTSNGESERVGLNLVYEYIFEFLDAEIMPNPIEVNRQYLISAKIRNERNLIVE